MNEFEKKTVYQVVNKIIYYLNNLSQDSSRKASLANLRNSIGRSVEQAMDAWSIVFEYIPDEYLSKDGNPTYEEKAIMYSLQLYALHQQGKSLNKEMEDDIQEKHYENIGDSIKILRLEGNQEAVDRRFNEMITASSFYELVEHLRHLVKLMKAKTNVQVDYARLAEDLFWFQKGKSSEVKFRWAQSYYSKRKKEEIINE